MPSLPAMTAVTASTSVMRWSGKHAKATRADS
jgi:hypothetical protein